MAVGKDTIFERFLSPIFRLMIDEDAIKRFADSIDWEKEGERISEPNVIYPEYYSSQNFHGIEKGYLNPTAAVSYDPITQYVLPPGEAIVRQGLIDAVKGVPRRILDLGCGTGSTTLMLKKALPEAEVIGLDLSPYMLIAAKTKAEKTRLDIQWRHGNAEFTGFPDASFDLVTASWLFLEMPPSVSQTILRESFRLLTVGGQVIILDGNQKTLRQTEWLTNVLEEPYIKYYAAGNLDAWMGAAGFGAVQTEDLWLVNQVTRGVKPMTGDVSRVGVTERENQGDRVPDFDLDGFPAPA
jgi:ubiquinone/menaquinone biosynthesis C-methylase UbiE